jgi:transcriptional regulator GlxA family with amidase domain
MKRSSEPAARSRHVVMVAFPDVQVLDVTGPLEVFGRSERWLRDHQRAGGYTLEIVGTRAGALRTSSGFSIVAERAYAQVRGGVDTLLLAGGRGTGAALRDRRLIAWLRAMAPRARRVGSVCTGAFLLAEAGLLDGKRATTHWGYCDRLAAAYPRVTVDPDPIFVRDGRVFTSAGVTAGMDLALALVEEDHGRQAALEVARELVLFLRRPGGQSQFSAQLAGQLAERQPLRELQSWIAEHVEADLSVPALARRVSMSRRNFTRVFHAEVGTSPGRFVERARVETARRLLEESADGLEGIAERAGFGCAESMRRSFLRTVRVAPSVYRERFHLERGAR